MWKPSMRENIVSPEDLKQATPEYGSKLAVGLGLYQFLEKVTMTDNESGNEFISYTFIGLDKDGNFSSKFSVTKFTGLWKVKGLIQNGRIRDFIGRVEDGVVTFLTFSWEEYDNVFKEEPVEAEA